MRRSWDIRVVCVNCCFLAWNPVFCVWIYPFSSIFKFTSITFGHLWWSLSTFSSVSHQAGTPADGQTISGITQKIIQSCGDRLSQVHATWKNTLKQACAGSTTLFVISQALHHVSHQPGDTTEGLTASCYIWASACHPLILVSSHLRATKNRWCRSCKRGLNNFVRLWGTTHSMHRLVLR